MGIGQIGKGGKRKRELGRERRERMEKDWP